MTGRTVLVLGAGYGGLTVVSELRSRLPPEHRVILVDQNDTLRPCVFNLDVMTGKRPAVPEGKLSSVAGRGVDFVQGRVERIDPKSRTVETSTGKLTGDYLVVAMGSELDPGQVPGFSESAFNLYEADGARELRGALAQLRTGRVVVMISRTPFKCPAAPYEAAFLIDWLFRSKGLREKVSVALYTPEWAPMAAAGDALGNEVVRMLAARGIDYHPEHMVLKIDPSKQRVWFEIDDVDYDVLVGVPPHVAPAPVREAGLTNSSGWVPVDPGTLETSFPGVYAVGDLVSIPLHNGRFLPMAGVFALGEGVTVATNLAARIKGGKDEAEFEGEGFCYLEMGGGEAAHAAGSFFAKPAPQVRFEAPSALHQKAKEDFANALLQHLRD
jgi:sulfide:quinone oxidoreductase